MPKHLSPVKAIKKYCYDCSGRNIKERILCSSINCPLYPYRLGSNPNRKGIGLKIKNLAQKNDLRIKKAIGDKQSIKKQDFIKKT